jgi:hypothetical protein
VLLGPYSRFYWHHPGPLYFDVLAVPSWLSGGRVAGLLVGLTLVNLAAAVGVIAVAVRRGGRALGACAAIVLCVYLAALGRTAFDFWSPNATLLPFAAVLVLSWSVACRDAWALPWLVVAGSFCIQTEVGLAPGVLAAIVMGVVCLGARPAAEDAAKGERWRTLRGPVFVAAAVGVVLWFPPIVEQLTSRRGNLSLLAQFFASSHPHHSLWDGIRATAFQASLLPRAVLSGGHVSDVRIATPYGIALGIFVLALAAAAVLVVRTRARSFVLLLSLAAVELVVAVYTVTRIVGSVESYLVEWVSAIALLVWVTLGGVCTEVVQRRARRGAPNWRRRVGVATLIGVVGAVATLGVVQSLPGDQEYTDRLQEHVTAAILPLAHERHAVVLQLASVSAWPMLAGVTFELERRGLDVEIVDTPETRLLFEPSDIVEPRPGRAVLAFRDLDSTGSGSVVVRGGRWEVARVTER